MTTATATAEPDRTETRLTHLENAQVENRERLARVEAKVDSLTATVLELNRRVDRLFYLGLAAGAGIIAALLLQPLIAAAGG